MYTFLCSRVGNEAKVLLYKFLTNLSFLFQIQCRDCRQESISSFHIVGLKCLNCSSYNTVRCGNEELPEDAEVALDDLRMQMVLDMIHQIVQARQRERMPALMQRIRERQAAREAAREAARQAAAGGGGAGGEGEGQGGGEEGDAVVPQIENDSHSGSEDHSDPEGRSGSDVSEGEGENTEERDPPELETDSGSYDSPPPVLESEDGSFSGTQGDSDDEESGPDVGMNSWPPFWALHSSNSDGSQESNSDASWETEEEEENEEENEDNSEDMERDLEDGSTEPTHSSSVAATSFASQASKGDIPPVRRSDRVSDDSQEWETASEEMSIDKDT